MPKFAANLSMLFTELPFFDRFTAAAQAGFEGVEFLFPYDYDKALLADCLGRNGLVQVSTPRLVAPPPMTIVSRQHTAAAQRERQPM